MREGSSSGPGLPGVAVTLYIQSSPQGLVTDPDGHSESRVYELHSESWAVVPSKEGYHFDPPEAGGRHWGLPGQNFEVVDFVALRGEPTTTPAEDRDADFVNAISIEPASGDKWFGTRSGVSRLRRDETLERYTTSDGLAHNWVNAVAIDAATGDKWFGTNYGVSRLGADGTWRTFTTADGLASDHIRAIAIDAATGDSWFGTNAGVSRYGRDGQWRAYSLRPR